MKEKAIFLLKSSRPRLNFALFIGVLMGLVHTSTVTIQNAMISALIMFFHGFAVFSINDYFDYETDSYSDAEYLKGVTAVDKRNLLGYSGSISVIAMIVIGYLSPGSAFLPVLGLGIFAISYSTPPLRLKSKPLIDSISNGFWVLCIFSVGLGLGTAELTIPIKAYWMAGFLSVGHSLASLPDIESDRKEGIKTSGMLLGWRKTISIELALIAASFYFLNWSKVTSVLLLGFTCYLFYIFVNPDEKHFYKGLRLMMPFSILYGIVWITTKVI